MLVKFSPIRLPNSSRNNYYFHCCIFLIMCLEDLGANILLLQYIILLFASARRCSWFLVWNKVGLLVSAIGLRAQMALNVIPSRASQCLGIWGWASLSVLILKRAVLQQHLTVIWSKNLSLFGAMRTKLEEVGRTSRWSSGALLLRCSKGYKR